MSALSAGERVESWLIRFFDWVNPTLTNSFWLFIQLTVLIIVAACSARAEPDSTD